MATMFNPSGDNRITDNIEGPFDPYKKPPNTGDTKIINIGESEKSQKTSCGQNVKAWASRLSTAAKVLAVIAVLLTVLIIAAVLAIHFTIGFHKLRALISNIGIPKGYVVGSLVGLGCVAVASYLAYKYGPPCCRSAVTKVKDFCKMLT